MPGEPKSCYEDVTLARSASPYLFPCTIIYSIIAAGIIYRLYQYIGVKVKQRWPSHTSLTSSVPQGTLLWTFLGLIKSKWRTFLTKNCYFHAHLLNFLLTQTIKGRRKNKQKNHKKIFCLNNSTIPGNLKNTVLNSSHTRKVSAQYFEESLTNHAIIYNYPVSFNIGATGIDCDKANKGLFFGLLVAVLTLIAIATFFVFETRINDSLTAIQVFYVTEIALMAITAVGIILGFMRLCHLKFLPSYFLSVDSVLLIVALAGSYIYLCFLLISAVTRSDFSDAIGILLIVTIVLAILQITLQIVFILDGLCRCAENDIQMSEKPGRSIVTFLLVCNLAMWAVSMFEVVTTRVVPLHESFYGVLAWNIITHLCVPLLIFFRFHSAICLSKIWYNAYQKERPS